MRSENVGPKISSKVRLVIMVLFAFWKVLASWGLGLYNFEFKFVTFKNRIIFDIIYYRQQTKLRQGYVFTSVFDSVHRGGLPQCTLGYHPPGADTPLEQAPHQTRYPSRSGTHPWSRHPLCTVHAGRYGQQTGGMHPTGMQSCLN